MNNVASFLPNLPACASTASQGPQGDSEALKNSQGDGDGFDAVLSGFSTHSPSGKQSANAAAPANSPATRGGSSRSLSALLPMTQGSFAGSSATAPGAALPGGTPAAEQYSKGPVSTTAFSKAISNAADVAGTQTQSGEEKDPSSAMLPAVPDASTLTKTPPSAANATPAKPVAGTSGKAPILSAPPAEKPVTVATAVDAASAAKPAAPKSDNAASNNVPAKTDAAANGSAAAIAGSLQSALPSAPASGSAAGKGPQSDHPTSGTSKSPDKKSSKSDTPASDAVNTATQAAMAASILAVVPPQAVPAGSAGSGGSKNQKPAVAPQINVTAQLATDTDVSPVAAQAQTDAVSPDSFAASATMTVTGMSSATHFAPVARLSPVQQIADAVVGAMPDFFQPSAGGALSDSTDATGLTDSTPPDLPPDPTIAASSGPVKTLNLELEPPSLGTVTITLNLTPAGLDVQLAASQSSTMNLIDKDKDNLSDQLRQSGYSLSSVAVTLGSHNGTNVANNGSATQNPNGQAASQSGSQPMSYGGSSNGNGSSQNNARNGSGGSPYPQGPVGGAAGSGAVAPSRRAAAGDLYL